MAELTEGVEYLITDWRVVPQAEGGPRIFIAGNITDEEVVGESEYAEFWVSAAMVATLPKDEAGQRAALNPWLKERVNARHLAWREKLATRPPQPESIPLEEVARIVGDPDDPQPRLRLKADETHHKKGTRPTSEAAGGQIPVDGAGRPPRRFSALGQPVAEGERPQQHDTSARTPTPSAATSAQNPTAPAPGAGASNTATPGTAAAGGKDKVK